MKNPTYSDDFALLYGILLGDGCLSTFGKGSTATVVTCSLHDDIPLFEEVVIPILKRFKDRKYHYSRRTSAGSIELKVYDKELFGRFREVDFPVGHKGINLQISEKFEKILYKEIIQGYFATDGCLVIANNNGTKYPRIEFTSISESLLTQVLKYLTDIGMNGGLYSGGRSSGICFGKYNRKKSHRIQFNGKKNLELFKTKIGFVNPKHTEKYEKLKRGAGTEI